MSSYDTNIVLKNYNNVFVKFMPNRRYFYRKKFEDFLMQNKGDGYIMYNNNCISNSNYKTELQMQLLIDKT